MNASVDVIVLTHNAEDTISDFLNAFTKNTHADHRLILMDNGSSDDTMREFLLFPNVLAHSSCDNLGVIGGRNKAFEHSSADIVVFLDDDQFVHPGWLSHHLDVMNRGYDIVGVEAWSMTSRFYPNKQVVDITDSFNYVGCGGMMIRRHVIDSIGLFDEAFSPAYFEDPDFCFRAIEAGYKIGWNVNAKITHLSHSTLGSDAAAEKRFLLSHRKFIEKWRGKPLSYMKQDFLPEFDQ